MHLYGGNDTMIYADNAATTEMDMDAFEAMRPFLLQQYGNASQPYSFGVESKKALNLARQTIAQCIGADPEEIYFTSGGTESDNWAIKMGGISRKSIVTSPIEHHAVLNSCNYLKNKGVDIFYTSTNNAGEISPKELETIIGMNTGLVSIMFANNEIGTIQNVKELAAATHRYGALFHTDAVQAVGHIDINVHKLDVDMLSASAHKFNGPKGIGFLYIKKGTNIASYINGGSQEFELRAGTENIASIVAMAVALEKNCSQIYKNKKHIEELEGIIINRLNKAGLKYMRNGSSNRIPGNMSISFKDKDGESILHRMDLQGVCISTGSACDSVNTQISHVISAIGVPNEFAEGTIRISLGKNNTLKEASFIADALISIVK